MHATERSSTATPKGGNRSVDVVCQSRSLMAGALYDFGENRRNVDELLGSLTDHETTLDWLSRREQSRVFDELAQRYAAS